MATAARIIGPNNDAEALAHARREMRIRYGCGVHDAHGDYEFWWKPRDDRNCLTIDIEGRKQVAVPRLRPQSLVRIAEN